MGRKVFISVLGIGPYSECHYVKEDFSFSTRYIQAATLKYLTERSENSNRWNEKDVAIIFTTTKSKQDQWIVGKAKEGKGKDTIVVEKTGLENELKMMDLPMSIVSKHIEDGKDEGEIWSIFNTIYGELNDNDELYLDITHALRYLPMLLLVLVNYAKFLKGCIVKSITYGNFMAEGDKKPIMDLTTIAALQEWTYAAGQYVDNGNVDQLVSLSNDQIRPILKETGGADVAANKLRGFITALQKVVNDFRTCRGLSIIQSTELSKLIALSNDLNSTMIDPLNPIFGKIKSSLVSFDEHENLRNALSAAKWCFDNKLYQQSATILHEFVVSYLCKRNSIDIDDDKTRECVNAAFNIRMKNIQEKDWYVKNDFEKTKKIKEILNDDLLSNENLVKLFSCLTIVRNDYNHSGMRKENPKTPKDMVSLIEKCLYGFALELYNVKY